MKVGELITQLQTLDPNSRVMVRGYEDGVNDVLEVRSIRIVKNKNTKWYDGLYAITLDGSGEPVVEIWGDNPEGKKE